MDKDLSHYLRRDSKPFKKLKEQLADIDVIVVEEGQTFPPSFLDICEQIFREVKAAANPANAFKSWGGINSS